MYSKSMGEGGMTAEDVVGGWGCRGIWGLKFCFDIVLIVIIIPVIIIIIIPVLEHGTRVRGDIGTSRGIV